MKIPKIAYILPLIFIIVMVIFIGYENLFQPSYWCNLAKKYQESSYNGLIVKKFIDKENHSAEKVLIKNSNKIIEMNLDSDTSGYFEYIKVGGSIIKAKDRLDLQIIRNNEIRSFSVYFGCK